MGSYQATVLSKHARMAHSEEPFFRLIGQKGDLVIAGTAPGLRQLSDHGHSAMATAAAENAHSPEP